MVLSEEQMERALNYLNQLVKRDPIASLNQALGETAELYLVGGSVRDAFVPDRQAPTTDIDLSVNLIPQEVADRLEACGIRTIEVVKGHGTLTALVEDKHVEITTFRKASARNENEFSDSIEEDLAGRDFTINAIAYNVKSGEIVDPFNGIADLRNNKLHAVGRAEDRFKEDPLRMLRLVRFGTAAGREVEKELIAAGLALRGLLKAVSPERIRDEFSKILISDHPKAALVTISEMNLFEIFLPEILPAIGFEQNEYHIHDVFGHILDVVEACPPNIILRLAGFFHDIGKPQTLSVDDSGRRHFYCHEVKSAAICRAVMTRLRYSKEEIRQVSLLVAEHMRTLTCGAAGVRRIMRDLDDMLDDWLALKCADKSPTMSDAEFQEQYKGFIKLLQEERQRLAEPIYGKLAVGGEDILALGLKSGPLVGEIINFLEELVIDNPQFNKKEILISKAREMLRSKGV